MSTYTFTKQDVLNSDLQPNQPNSISYRTKTSNRTFGGYKFTTVTLVLNNPPGYGKPPIPATIDWKKSRFQIDGVIHNWTDLKQKPQEGRKFKERVWRWNRYSYLVKYKDDTWTATPSDSPNTVVAALSPYKIHLRTKPDPGSLSLWPGVPFEDRMFLMLVLLYSEGKRQDKKVCVLDNRFMVVANN
ncbi:hypothetical protein H0H87_008953 [Tephrocybe sp. NHM501043]|nr:hypothetical protein H0H87_008953 [Tephrocybe sp. NHM501043]